MNNRVKKPLYLLVHKTQIVFSSDFVMRLEFSQSHLQAPLIIVVFLRFSPYLQLLPPVKA